MHPTSFRASTPILLASVLLSISAFAALADNSTAPAAKTPADIQATYERDRAKCLSGQSQEDQATCLKEAGAARDEAKRGMLSEDGTAFHKNAKARCDVLTGDEQRDCIARAHGSGSVSGSVDGGGLLKETHTIVPAAPAASGAPTP
jgi:hypothetical protein